LSSRQPAENSFEELLVTAAVRFLRLPQANRAAGEDLMAYRMRFTSCTEFTEARRELAAEVRDLADRLDGQEPDYTAVHDAWEGLVELAERTERLRTQFVREQPEQEAWLIEKRPWLDPKL
jgi:hypothetical protein